MRSFRNPGPALLPAVFKGARHCRDGDALPLELGDHGRSPGASNPQPSPASTHPVNPGARAQSSALSGTVSASTRERMLPRAGAACVPPGGVEPPPLRLMSRRQSRSQLCLALTGKATTDAAACLFLLVQVIDRM